MGIWVDTDFGFDDLWALLILSAEGITVDGVSLVAGNSALEQVAKNALGACEVFKTDWPLCAGAAQPLHRKQETAERILGPSGMMSRGMRLPDVAVQELPAFAPAMREWLTNGQSRHEVLALGPLTNLAILGAAAPQEFAMIDRIVWMGGASGRGNHSAFAEFNALADPEAAAQVLASGIDVDIVDLEICRSVTFAESDMPKELSPLLRDLLGGYLDIALSRGRREMAIYDPLAALALCCPEAVEFRPFEARVDIDVSERYGQTTFAPSTTSPVRLGVAPVPDAATRCLTALRKASQ